MGAAALETYTKTQQDKAATPDPERNAKRLANRVRSRRREQPTNFQKTGQDLHERAGARRGPKAGGPLIRTAPDGILTGSWRDPDEILRGTTPHLSQSPSRMHTVKMGEPEQLNTVNVAVQNLNAAV